MGKNVRQTKSLGLIGYQINFLQYGRSMNQVLLEPDAQFEINVPVLVVGGGGCGLSAALAARDCGVDVVVLERDRKPLGTTAMSTGLIPAAGTIEQAQAGIVDSPELFAADVAAKTKGQAPAELVAFLAQESAQTIAWLRDTHQAPLTLVTGFLYPGHSAMRMYGTPNRTGSELMAALGAAAERAGVDVLTDALAQDLIVDARGKVLGVQFQRPDGSLERLGCQTLILGCCGFAGNRDLVAQHIPEILDATFHGHPGNKGTAHAWGLQLGAALGDMDSYQGHGGLAYGHGIPILWPVIMQGGFQVNCDGERFSDESLGYSEQAVKVVAQAGQAAWTIYDETIHTMMGAFDDYRDAISAGAVVEDESIEGLAGKLGLPAMALVTTIDGVGAMVSGNGIDAFGRDFSQSPTLKAPYFAAKVTGALFHTQGGLVVDAQGRVLRQSGEAFPNLFAGGGAARGVSGKGASGYLAGNGLWTATTLGRLAGQAAAQQVIAETGK
jgi:fumarate reductase flavoprotein subunit